MDRKEQFLLGLSALREKAGQNFGHITIPQILACFPDQKLTKDQIREIYRYAEEEKIFIEDYKPRDTRSVSVGEPKLTGEEKATFRMYLKDLENVRRLSEEEADALGERLAAGEDVLERLTEGYLHLVLDLARRHAGKGVLIGDLVQEGNMGLFEALAEIPARGGLLAGGLTPYVTARIERSMKRSVAEQAGQAKTGERIAREANRLLAATLEFEEENEREASLSELSEKTGLSEGEIRELIQISLDAAALGDAADQDQPAEKKE